MAILPHPSVPLVGPDGKITREWLPVFNAILGEVPPASDDDADTLQGQDGAYYLARENHTGTQAFSTLTGTPTTLAGYGIADAAPLSHVGSGGTAHANAVAAGSAGFMTGADKTKLDGIASGATAYTDELAQDAVGGTLTDTSTVDFTYNDGANTITADVKDDSITFAKIQNIATDSLIGRDTASTGDPETISVTGGIEFSGSGSIRTSAFTGDVTKSAGGTALTVANDTVTYAKMQNVSATDKILGRSSAGSGDVQEIACTAFARSILDDPDAATVLDTLGVSDISTSTSLAERLKTITIPPDFIAAVLDPPNRYDIFPVECRAPGEVRMSKSPRRLFDNLSQSGSSNNVWVSNAGDDSHAGTEVAPLLTLDYAISTSVAQNVYVEPGFYDPFTFRSDVDAAGAVVKRIVNARSGSGRPVVIGVFTGMPSIASATWTLASGKTNTWETTLSLSGSSVPHRIVFTERFDKWGFYDRATNYSSLTDLETDGADVCGWNFNAGSGKLSMTFFGGSIEANKSKFRALYLDSSGAARIFLFGGVKIIFDGVEGDFVFDGIDVETLNDAANSPVVGLVNVISQYSPAHGIGAVGGVIYSSGCRFHAPMNDGFNYNPSGAGDPAFAVEHNCCATMGGDVTSFPDNSENRNGSSGHGGSNVIRAGGFYADNLGPNVVDTTETGYDSLTWNVGVVTQKSAAVSNYGGIQNAYSVGGTRTMWNDSCRTIDEVTSLTSIGGAGAVTYHVNGEYNVTPAASGGASLATYSRPSP